MKAKGIAVLVGCSAYQTPSDAAAKLSDLPQVADNIQRFRKFLLRKGFNDLTFDEDQIITVTDPKSVEDVGNAVDVAIKARPEFLLFYYSGHGLRLNNEFQMALSSSTVDGPDYKTYPEDTLRNQLKKQPTIKRKLIIFDCCYAGAGVPGAMSASAADKNLPFNQKYFEDKPLAGTAYLAACDARSLTYAINTQKYTTFSGELLSVLEAGVAPERRSMSVGDVFDMTRKRVVDRIRALPDTEQVYYGEPIAAYVGDISEFPLLAYKGAPPDPSSNAIFKVIGKLIDRRGGRFDVSPKNQMDLTKQITKLVTSKDDPELRIALDSATLDRLFENAQLGVTLVLITAPTDRAIDLEQDVHPIYANPRSYEIHLGQRLESLDPKLLEQGSYLAWISNCDAFRADQVRVLKKLAEGKPAEPVVPMTFNAPETPGVNFADGLHPNVNYHGKSFYPLTLAFQKISSDDSEARYLLLVGLLGAGRISAFKKVP